MKARARTYEEGLKYGIKVSTEAFVACYTVAMDDKGLCKNTIRRVTKRADLLFEQVLNDALKLEEIFEESENILGE